MFIKKKCVTAPMEVRDEVKSTSLSHQEKYARHVGKRQVFEEVSLHAVFSLLIVVLSVHNF